MRVYFRTSKHTGVSFGWFGTLLVVLFWMAVLGLPIYVAELLFSTWWSAVLTVLTLVVALALYGRTKGTRGDGNGAH